MTDQRNHPNSEVNDLLKQSNKNLAESIRLVRGLHEKCTALRAALEISGAARKAAEETITSQASKISLLEARVADLRAEVNTIKETARLLLEEINLRIKNPDSGVSPPAILALDFVRACAKREE